MKEFNLPWMVIAKEYIGTQEIPGSKSNQKIMEWATQLGGWVKSYYTNDDIPWCGLFVAECLRESDIEILIKNPLSALEWNKFGIKCEPMFGAIMVFVRSGGGHVGFYVSEDNESYHILGGNQSNAVNITRVGKDRFKGARWPTYLEHLQVPGRVIKKFDGKLSQNEQ